jgi:hypothetical protein
VNASCLKPLEFSWFWPQLYGFAWQMLIFHPVTGVQSNARVSAKNWMSLSHAPLYKHTVHRFIDMQNVFAQPTYAVDDAGSAGDWEDRAATPRRPYSLAGEPGDRY